MFPQSILFCLRKQKTKFPESEVIVAGLPPRFSSDEIRTKVKDFNEATKRWCGANNVKFIDNEAPFEFRNGDIDCSAYIMTGETPKLHLTRKGTLRLLENLQKDIPELVLDDSRNQGISQPDAQRTNKPGMWSYSQAVKRPPVQHQYQNEAVESWNSTHQRDRFHLSVARGCFHCGERNHMKSQCKHTEKLRYYNCQKLGHKSKFCGKSPF